MESDGNGHVWIIERWEMSWYSEEHGACQVQPVLEWVLSNNVVKFHSRMRLWESTVVHHKRLNPVNFALKSILVERRGKLYLVKFWKETISEKDCRLTSENQWDLLLQFSSGKDKIEGTRISFVSVRNLLLGCSELEWTRIILMEFLFYSGSDSSAYLWL